MLTPEDWRVLRHVQFYWYTTTSPRVRALATSRWLIAEVGLYRLSYAAALYLKGKPYNVD